MADEAPFPFSSSSWARRWRARSPDFRTVAATTLLATLLFVPYLGAVGLWDPWETHYGEVAREMVQRRDYVFPYFEDAWFFSKPPLTMWMQALGMQVVGTLRSEGALGRYTEWGMRFPFALFSMAAVSLLSLAVTRIRSLRAGLATGFVLATMPLYFLLTRQAVTDTPFVATLTCALACALIGQLDERTQHRAAWWYAFYVLCGLSTLAKGLLGIGLPAVILMLYGLCTVVPLTGAGWNEHLRWLFEPGFRARVRQGESEMPALWAQFRRMKLGTGVLVFFAVAAPWYLTLSLFEGVDNESKSFWYRFFIHDHFNRLSVGVHTTTPGGTFIYFLEQGAFAIFPWVALAPGALAVLFRLRFKPRTRAEHLTLVAALWVAFTFTLLSLSATKFHHYVFPVLPGLAVLIAVFIDELWEEGVAAHAGSLAVGLLFFALVGRDLASTPKHFTDLFVYRYDRPYPLELLRQPWMLFSSRPLWTGDLLCLLLLALGASLAVEAFSKEGSVSSRATALLLLLPGAGFLLALVSRGGIAPLFALGFAFIVVAAYLGYAGAREKSPSGTALGAVLLALGGAALMAQSLRSAPQSDPLMAALIQPVNLILLLGLSFTGIGALCAVAALQQAKNLLFASFWVFTLSFALWFNWGHWVDLSHHWTQRDLFLRYYRQRQPQEPIAAFLMNWHGETFYSRNTVRQIKDNATMGRYAAQEGREWALVEHHRLGLLRTAVGPDRVVRPVEKDLNNKFVLVTID